MGEKCHKCNKLNHFSVACKNKRVYEVEDNRDGECSSEATDEEYFVLESVVCQVQSSKSEWKETICVNKTKILFKIDTGAEVNILPVKKFRALGLRNTMAKSNKCLKSYTGHSLKVLGTCKLKCTARGKTEWLEFFVVDQESNALLGLGACEKLGFISRGLSENIDNVESCQIIKEYNDVFKGKLGKLPYIYDIKLKENAEPRIAAPRMIPISLKDKVKCELDHMVQEGILKKVTEPTDWVHPIVVVQKPNKQVRICMDPRPLNKYIRREHYPIPTQQAIFSQLEGAKYFSVLDASCAFLQIPLSEDSSDLCTISTPFGRYKFCRLPYGLASSPEVYQRTIDNIFAGIEGIHVYIDDILIHGKTEQEHDKRLKEVLDKAREYGLRLSKAKSQIKVTSVKYLGYTLSSAGLTVNKEKIKAISEYQVPSNKVELQRFIGMITYLGKFIPNLSSKTGILRQLLSNKNEFVWTVNEQKAFEVLKSCVVSSPVLSYFDPGKECTVSVDASQYGLGALLLQSEHPIAYASASLNETQQRYSQIEKELLAILNGCRKFHYFLYGKKFIVESDHKPLIGLLKKTT